MPAICPYTYRRMTRPNMLKALQRQLNELSAIEARRPAYLESLIDRDIWNAKLSIENAISAIQKTRQK